jgi:hypothetical protein
MISRVVLLYPGWTALYRAKVGCFAPEWGGFGGGLAKVSREPVWPDYP